MDLETDQVQVNEQLEATAAPTLAPVQTPPKSLAGTDLLSGQYSDPFGEELYSELEQDQETPNAASFQKNLPVEDAPESPLASKEVSRSSKSSSLTSGGCFAFDKYLMLIR